MKVSMNIDRVISGIAETSARDAKAPRGGSSPLAGPHFIDKSPRPPRKMSTGSGAPSICWHCGSQLQRAPGRGLGLFYFNLVEDRAGVAHRVHGNCTQPAMNDGAKLLPAIRERATKRG